MYQLVIKVLKLLEYAKLPENGETLPPQCTHINAALSMMKISAPRSDSVEPRTEMSKIVLSSEFPVVSLISSMNSLS